MPKSLTPEERKQLTHRSVSQGPTIPEMYAHIQKTYPKTMQTIEILDLLSSLTPAGMGRNITKMGIKQVGRTLSRSEVLDNLIAALGKNHPDIDKLRPEVRDKVLGLAKKDPEIRDMVEKEQKMMQAANKERIKTLTEIESRGVENFRLPDSELSALTDLMGHRMEINRKLRSKIDDMAKIEEQERFNQLKAAALERIAEAQRKAREKFTLLPGGKPPDGGAPKPLAPETSYNLETYAVDQLKRTAEQSLMQALLDEQAKQKRQQP